MHSKLARPVVIGLVGGVASGKSYVGELLASQGALRIDADRLGHEVLKQAEVCEQLASLWGDGIFSPPGEVDRKKLAALVFGDSESATRNRRLLESIVHPRIRQLAEQQIASARAGTNVLTAIVVDAPLLLEAGWEPLCDLILFVDAPAEVRLQRALGRGWTQQSFQDREASQLSLSEKRSRATHIIDNGPDANVSGQIDRLWKELNKRLD
jgi:dephospho-CoA kinase